MNMEELLDQLDEMLDKSMKIPGGKSLISIEKFRIVIDDIRLNVPQEIKQARGIVADRAEIIANAKKEAEGIIHSAEERARAMVAQEEIQSWLSRRQMKLSLRHRQNHVKCVKQLRTLLMKLCAEPTKVFPQTSMK